MSLLSRLFGGGGGSAKPEPEPEVYEGFRIYAEPIAEGGKYRLAARIEKDLDGETKTHRLIRADTFDSAEAAASISTAKAKQVIDERGDDIFA